MGAKERDPDRLRSEFEQRVDNLSRQVKLRLSFAFSNNNLWAPTSYLQRFICQFGHQRPAQEDVLKIRLTGNQLVDQKLKTAAQRLTEFSPETTTGYQFQPKELERMDWLEVSCQHGNGDYYASHPPLERAKKVLTDLSRFLPRLALREALNNSHHSS